MSVTTRTLVQEVLGPESMSSLMMGPPMNAFRFRLLRTSTNIPTDLHYVPSLQGKECDLWKKLF